MRLLRRVTPLPGFPTPRARDRRHGRRRHPHHLKRWELGLGGAVGVGAVALGAALFATHLVAPDDTQRLSAYISAHAQRLEVDAGTPAPAVSAATGATSAPSPASITTTAGSTATQDLARDGYGATAGLQTLAASGTNVDWAKIVLLDGGWPQTDANVTVLTRWMRQENGVDDWWNRNNPLNMGAGGFGTFANLLTAAQAVATGASPTAVADQVCRQLVGVLSLRGCVFQPGVAGIGAPTLLEQDGRVTISRQAWDADRDGLPPSTDTELLAEANGFLQGRFLMTPQPGAHPTHEQRLVAVALADQAAAALASSLSVR